MAAGWLGCQHHPTHEQVRAYDAQLLKVLGKAKQPDIIALLGQPQVRDVIGEIEVWMYQFSDNGEPVRGRPEVAMVAPDRDELILSFDRDQTLQSYHVVIEGRKTRRGKN